MSFVCIFYNIMHSKKNLLLLPGPVDPKDNNKFSFILLASSWRQVGVKLASSWRQAGVVLDPVDASSPDALP